MYCVAFFPLTRKLNQHTVFSTQVYIRLNANNKGILANYWGQQLNPAINWMGARRYGISLRVFNESNDIELNTKAHNIAGTIFIYKGNSSKRKGKR